MSAFNVRDIARATPDRAAVPALVPEHIRARYADQMTRIPRIRLDIRRAAPARTLPAVGSFYG